MQETEQPGIFEEYWVDHFSLMLIFLFFALLELKEQMKSQDLVISA